MSSDCHIKTYRFLKRTYALSVDFEMKPNKIRFPVLRQKPTQILP